MKNIDDLISSATSIYSRYKAGRIERETVREWVLGLGGYPQPHADAIIQAASWFRPIKSDLTPEALTAHDLEYLRIIAEPEAGHVIGITSHAERNAR